MTDLEKAYFDKLYERSKVDELVKSRAAAEYLIGLLTPAVKTSQGINGNLFCKMLSTLTGISVANAAKNISSNASSEIPRSKIETKAGIFWMGDDINQILFGNKYSVWNIVMSGYSEKKGKDAIPDLGLMIESNAKNIGNPEIKLWGGMASPYSDFDAAKNTYLGIISKLEPYKLSQEEYPQAFAFALMDVIMKVEATFPKDLNCAKIAIEYVMFTSHMDV